MTTDATQKNTGRQRPRSAAELRELDRQAFQLKIAGVNFPAIAQALGYTNSSGAFKAYQRHLAAIADPDTVEHHRNLELQRLEDLRAALYNQAVGDPGGPGRQPTPPDLEAITRLLQIHDRKTRLLGLHRAPSIDPTEELIAYAEAHDLDPDLVLRQADAIIAGFSKKGRL